MDNFFEIIEQQKDNLKTAIVDESRALNYNQLYASCILLSSLFNKKGIKKEDRITIFLPNSAEFAVSLFTCFRQGAIAVPINHKFKKNEIEYYIKDSAPALILTSDALKSVLMEVNNKLENKIVCIKGENQDFDVFSDNCPETEYKKSATNEKTKAIYLYSTGSTGVPKRVTRTHRNLIALANNHSETVGWNGSEKILFTLPISHTYALGNFISAIKSAMTSYLLEEFNRRKVSELIEREKITIYPCVPFMLDILSESNIDPKAFGSLRLVISAGAPLSKDTFERFFNSFKIAPRQLYGSSETGVISINLDSEIAETSDSVGAPVKGVEVRIINDDGSDAKTGQMGEIIVKSNTMTTGYDNLLEETEKVFRNGYYNTRDLGYIDNKGMIYIKGRKKLLINISGNKVDPVEIENVLSLHPKVKESAVIGIMNENGRESIKAFVVGNESIDKSDIIPYLKDKIADYKIPQTIEFVESLPKSPTGKILRNKLS